jgi:hypothetical protein
VVTFSSDCLCSNIDSRIRQAETEYQLEREETNVLNLQEEKRCLLLRLSTNGAKEWGVSPNQQDVSLFRSVNSSRERVVILTVSPVH